jgi:hypothetical protein
LPIFNTAGHRRAGQPDWMESLEPAEARTRSFIIRIWREPRSTQDEEHTFRGLMVDVITGEQQFFLDLETLVGYLVAKTDFPRSSK